MKNLLFALTFTLLSTVRAQHTISGTFSPAKDYTWIIAYSIQPGTQGYVADTKIENGKFTLHLPQTAKPGTYRLVYAVPQEEFNFDVLYDGKENIELAFDGQKGLSFKVSQENKIFHAYFQEINGVKQKFIDFYNAKKTDEKSFDKLIKELNDTQEAYEESTKGMLVNQFIKANRPYVPTKYEATETYWQQKKDHYFDYLDFKNPLLRASNYLTDKAANYVFTAITTEKRAKETTESVLQENTKTLADEIKETEPSYQLHIFNTLWSRASAGKFDATADFIYNNYLKGLAEQTDNQKILQEIDTHNRLRIGAVSPDIEWKDGFTTKKLSELEGAECYVLVFWSSTCPHCLNELPPLSKKLMDHPNIKVIAVGLEDDEANWKKESAKLKGFEHAIALGRWDSNYAKLFDIHRTPTYYILDSEKRIMTKPESDKDVVAFIEN